jgi:hypothetical protein
MIQSGVCYSFKVEILDGVHVLATDNLKIALYTSAADLSKATTVYTGTGEAYDSVWLQGGRSLLPVAGWPKLDAFGRATMRFQEIVATGVTLTFRAMLIYNASKANRAIMVLDKGVDTVLTGGTLRIGANPAQPDLIFIV